MQTDSSGSRGITHAYIGSRGNHRARVSARPAVASAQEVNPDAAAATGRAGCCTARNSAVARSSSSTPTIRTKPWTPAAFRCVWPERLTLTVDARGGNFTQRWQVFAESWVALPGDTEHWPRDVRLNGAPARGGAIATGRACCSRRGNYTVDGPLRVERAPGVAADAVLERHRRSHRRRPARRAARTSRRRRLARQAPQRRAGRGHGSAGVPAAAATRSPPSSSRAFA